MVASLYFGPMQKYAVIVAGGIGKRMGGDLPKQFLEVGGKPILVHTLECFHRFDATIEMVVVMAESWVDTWSSLVDKHDVPAHKVVVGGKERFHSVKNGLDSLSGEGVVAIHDAVRPLVSHETLARCFDTADSKGNAIPVVPLKESLRMLEDGENSAVDRSKFRVVQTPQCFKLALIQSAFSQGYNSLFTDDASVFESAGNAIHLVDGNDENIKITTPADLQFAALML